MHLWKQTATTLISFAQDGYVRRTGWLRTLREQRCVDATGRPIPWMTYPSIAFLEPRLRPTMKVFEYGSGASTKWWAARVEQVIACEHEPTWHAKVAADLPSNVMLLQRDVQTGAYASEVAKHGRTFDVIVIDGRDRVACARHSLSALVDDGVVVWDNSDREEYAEGYRTLTEAGFRRIDFEGMGPLNPYAWCTSIFYRTKNCLGI